MRSIVAALVLSGGIVAAAPSSAQPNLCSAIIHRGRRYLALRRAHRTARYLRLLFRHG